MDDLKPTEFLRFEELPNEGTKIKTRRFTVWSAKHHDALGGIRWYGRWRQYVFEPALGTTFNNDCLWSIADRISYLNTMHRPPGQAPSEVGQSLLEYALVILLVALAVIVMMAVFGQTVGNMFSTIVGSF
jgi:pilus assembly protein Flp/PilA